MFRRLLVLIFLSAMLFVLANTVAHAAETLRPFSNLTDKTLISPNMGDGLLPH
jgi:hypothetical protein